MFHASVLFALTTGMESLISCQLTSWLGVDLSDLQISKHQSRVHACFCVFLPLSVVVGSGEVKDYRKPSSHCAFGHRVDESGASHGTIEPCSKLSFNGNWGHWM